ncbi:hypothetical protein TSUD_414100 [Trifolium subterraneum]|uniref:Uncharacterized protein n=1 Tax=Trifolium subterraneum TaxID=3900 RepID=A0A2Z6PW26_TRISU|nr:hypothetical protein TSUD_414100 [Trifolium subterraneum]
MEREKKKTTFCDSANVFPSSLLDFVSVFDLEKEENGVSDSELSSRRAILRLRFYSDIEWYVVSLKAKAVIVNGVSRVEGDEEDLDPKVGRDCVAEPGKLGLVESRIMGRVKEEFGVVGENGF